MPARSSYDYAVIRVVPRVEREEFVNVGVLVSCPQAGLLVAGIELDPGRLRALDPSVDVEAVRLHLQAIERICQGGRDAGPIGQLPARARFHWLTAKRSSIIQMSPVHTGRCLQPQDIAEHLLERMVRVPKPG
ncbi:DUF3037 domain-containing protein [Pseudomonas sp. CGJS7]|uniref:DUF3037 domain-containing protein n=1 Tax=Pseudomonas sp. CGJS7 TaxID=3109348 RepID=UPI00300A8937